MLFIQTPALSLQKCMFQIKNLLGMKWFNKHLFFFRELYFINASYLFLDVKLTSSASEAIKEKKTGKELCHKYNIYLEILF